MHICPPTMAQGNSGPRKLDNWEGWSAMTENRNDIDAWGRSEMSNADWCENDRISPNPFSIVRRDLRII